MNIREKGNIITFLGYLCISVFIHTHTPQVHAEFDQESQSAS